MVNSVLKLLNTQFVKFFFIGGMAAVMDLALLYIFTEIFGLYYLLSAVLGFTIVTSIAFFVHKKYTFNCTRKDAIRQYVTFFIVNIFGLGIYSAVLFVWVEYFFMHYLYVAIFGKFVAFIWNFLANKYLTFRI